MQRLLKYGLYTLIAFCLPTTIYAGNGKKALNALATKETITIDGKLNERAWQQAEKATGFTQFMPRPGLPSSQDAEVSILYDNDAVYVGAMLYDSHPDSILTQLSSRDDIDNNNDGFGVCFDTYSDDQNAFAFMVTAAGVQGDAKLKFDGSDFSWNAAWYSQISFNEKGWCVEMKIPYSSLRFPKSEVQKWGVNFIRSIRRCREKSHWSAFPPSESNFVGHFGTLNGIRDVQSPIRLILLPYVSAYAENYAGANAHTFNGGLDVKYGINDAFTLDMTLVPDFGQTLYDNRVLNLSPVEVRYDERRYFFTEGLDLFNKNDLFYSRRVGGQPVKFGSVYDNLTAGDVVTENPSTTKIYNATKISGRTKHNLGVGVFNAITAPAYAVITDTMTDAVHKIETAPLTNYNVVVLDQALKNNSCISFVNTNVWRQQNSYNADVSALLFKFANNANSYGINGSSDVSQLYYMSKPVVGYRYYFDVGKIKGNYTYRLSTRSISDDFNPNDLGYLDRNNITYYQFDQWYNIYKPVWKIMESYNHFGVTQTRVYNPGEFMQFDVYGSHNVTLRNYLTCGPYWDIVPAATNDWFEPRKKGRFYKYPSNYMVGGFASSDYRKKFALDLESNYRWFDANHRYRFYVGTSPRYRFNDKFSMVCGSSWNYAKNDVGFVDNINDSIYLGVRIVRTITANIDAAYIFTNTMSLKLSARQYWSQAKYSDYGLLSDDGSLAATNYNTNHDINFNTFNVFLNFVWQFKPGSEMSVVYQNSIYSSGSEIVSSYTDDLNRTFQSPQSNSLSVKVIYYLDYLTLRKLL